MIKNATHEARQLPEREFGERRAADKDAQPDVHQADGIANLVLKYFEDEIREALAEAQRELEDKALKIKTAPVRQQRRGK